MVNFLPISYIAQQIWTQLAVKCQEQILLVAAPYAVTVVVAVCMDSAWRELVICYKITES